MIIVGIDPGQTTGLCLLDPAGAPPELAQLTPGLVLRVVRELAPQLLAVEKFVVGPRAARSATPQAGAITRDLIGALTDWATSNGVRVAVRSASQVKPWATDARLKAAGLYLPDQRHARDAARHALFAAVSDCGMPDPLSKRSTPPARPCSPTGV